MANEQNGTQNIRPDTKDIKPGDPLQEFFTDYEYKPGTLDIKPGDNIPAIKVGNTSLNDKPPQEIVDAKNQYDKALEEIFRQSLEKGDTFAKGLQAEGKIGWNKDGKFTADLSAVGKTGWYTTARDQILNKIGEKSRAAGELMAGVDEIKRGASNVEMPDGKYRLSKKENGSIAFEEKKDFTQHLNPWSSPFKESPGRTTWEMLWGDMRAKREVKLQPSGHGKPTSAWEFAQNNSAGANDAARGTDGRNISSSGRDGAFPGG